MNAQPQQRVRLAYAVGDSLAYASVLDMTRLWERLLRRAGVPLAYTQGYSPHPRLQFAAPLPVGYTSSCELLDIWLTEVSDPLKLAKAIHAQEPPGLELTQVQALPAPGGPSPQAEMRGASYRVWLPGPCQPGALARAAANLLAQERLPRQRQRKGQLRDYDLRPLIVAIGAAHAEDGGCALPMALRLGPQGAGRPEEVVAAMGLPLDGIRIHRCRLIWGEQEGDWL